MDEMVDVAITFAIFVAVDLVFAMLRDRRSHGGK